MSEVAHLFMSFWPSVCLLWRIVSLDRLSIFFFDGVVCFFLLVLLSCRRCLLILEINRLSVDSFANIFSDSVGFLFILFRVSFAVQKLLSIIKSHFYIFVFTAITLRCGSEKIFLLFMSESVWPMFSSKCIIVSGGISRSLIHYEFFCVYGVRKYSNFILLHVAIEFSQHLLLNRVSFLHCIFLPPL